MKRPLPAVLLLLTSACVTTAQEGEQMQKDIASLRSDFTAAQKKQEQEAQQQKKQLQDTLDQLARASRKSGADLAVDLEKAQNDLSSLRGQIEVLQHRMDAMEKSSQDQLRTTDAFSQFMNQQKKEAEHPTDRGALYNLARQKLDAGQTGQSRALFQDFLNRYPKDELAANAQYWLGETFYAEKKWNDAIVEFQKVLKEYKGSEKVPDAVLKIGMSFQAQGDCQNALLFFEEVQQSHKGTPAAKTASERAGECRKKKKK